MVKEGGVFVLHMAVPEGRHEFIYVVDGMRRCFDIMHDSVQNAYGGRNNVLFVQADEIKLKQSKSSRIGAAISTAVVNVVRRASRS